MKGKISLKKEIANIIDNAEHLGDRKVKCNRYNMVQTNMCVAEVVNEHGYKCTYYFKGSIIATSGSYSKRHVLQV